MNDPNPPAVDPVPNPVPEPAPAPQPADAGKPPLERHQGHGLAYAVIVVFLLGMAFGIWGLWKVFAPDPGNPAAQLQAQQERLAALQQQVANLTRSDQVSRNANTALQGTLAERDEEIAGLKADVAFYERFVGGTAQRRGLTVHGLRLQSQGGGAWHFTATLTQTLNRAAVSSGTLTLEVEGSRNDSLERLPWDALRQSEDAPGIEYSFKYFQQVDGDLLLPEGFRPLRLIVRLAPPRGEAVEESFPWAEAAAATPRSAPDA